jgi:hypothetical protein
LLHRATKRGRRNNPTLQVAKLGSEEQMNELNTVLLFIPLGVALILMALIGARLNKLQGRILELSRVEAKLDLLLKQANIQFDPFVHVPREIAEAVRSGKKIEAIKLQRQSSGMGLKESKEFIEEIERRAGVS